MTELPVADFNAALASARNQAKALKLADVKKLLTIAGKRPTDAQLAEMAELVKTSPDYYRLVFQLVADAELSRNASASLSKLASNLRPNLEQLFCRLPPPQSGAGDEVSSWLQSEIVHAGEGKDNAEKIRAILLWVLRQYRNPDLFIASCIQLGQYSGKPSLKGNGRGCGFAFQKIAKKVAVIGSGKQPRLSKLLDQITPVIAMQNHLQEKLTLADRATKKLEETEQRLTRANAKIADLDSRVSELHSHNIQLEKSVAEAQQSAAGWQQKHEDAIAHGASESNQATTATLSQLRAKISPKLKDTLLYLNRPTPAVDQVKRLIVEIEKVLEG